MRTKKPLIIIPAYREAENIEALVDDIIENHPDFDYVIVNDGSGDETRSICQRRGYQFLDLPINMGIGGAVQTGYRYALRNGYEIAVQVDGDGQHDVAQLEQVVAPIREGRADIAIGSRFLEKEGFQSSLARRSGIRFLSGLIFLCTGRRVRDVTSGYRAVNQKFLAIYAAHYPNDYPEPEAIVAAFMHGAAIEEVPVVMRERQGGKSSIRAGKSIYYMVKVTLAILIARISFGVRRG